jgi:hypothetical protein
MHTSERGTAVNQLIQQNTKRPDVERVIVILVLYHFRSHVFESTAKSVPLLHMIGLDAPTEIADLNNITLLDQNILRFDVSMNKSLLMQIVNARANLNEEVESRVLAQIFLFTNEIKQISF